MSSDPGPIDATRDLRWALAQHLLDEGILWPERAIAGMCRTLADALSGSRWCYVVAGRGGPAAHARASAAIMASWNTLHIEYDARCSPEERAAWEQLRERVRFVDDPGGRQLMLHAGRPRLKLTRRFYAAHPGAPIPLFLDSLGVRDRLLAATPLTRNLEVWVIVDRTEHGHFGDDDAVNVEQTMPIIAQGAYRLCLHRGWLESSESLTPRERETLAHLLAGHSEARCAEALGLSVGSTHQNVVRIFRKLGVSTRAELMARCLGPIKQELLDASPPALRIA